MNAGFLVPLDDSVRVCVLVVVWLVGNRLIQLITAGHWTCKSDISFDHLVALLVLRTFSRHPMNE